jgi:hypothetical protein
METPDGETLKPMINTRFIAMFFKNGTGRVCSKSYKITRNRSGAGSFGKCFCPVCGAAVPHRLGLPCSSIICKNCGAIMVKD